MHTPRAERCTFAAWMFIVWRRPFEVGDRIQIGEVSGDVVDQRIFQFSVMEIGNWVDGDQQTGRIVQSPTPACSASRSPTSASPSATSGTSSRCSSPSRATGRTRSGCSRGSRASTARASAPQSERHAADAAGRLLLPAADLQPSVYTSVEDSGVSLAMRFLTEPRRRRERRQRVWEDVLRAFAQRPDIAFAYPTQRFFSSWMEGERASADAGDAVGERDPSRPAGGA